LPEVLLYLLVVRRTKLQAADLGPLMAMLIEISDFLNSVYTFERVGEGA
jgi:hypothetical protein